MPESKKKDYRNPMLAIRISPEMDERLNQVSSLYGVSKNEIARIAIGQYVGNITGTLDSISRAQANVDYEKLLSIMIPKLLEAERGLDKCKE
jgi:predicted transcriptional regulator